MGYSEYYSIYYLLFGILLEYYEKCYSLNPDNNVKKFHQDKDKIMMSGQILLSSEIIFILVFTIFGSDSLSCSIKYPFYVSFWASF